MLTAYVTAAAGGNARTRVRYADVCWRMPTYADRLERQLAALQPQAAAHELASGMHTSADVC